MQTPDPKWQRLGALLPLPLGRKTPPPQGWTGIGAPYPDMEQQQNWVEMAPDNPRNWAIRLWPDVIGIDIDAYHGGIDTMRRAINEWGALPSGPWSSSGREDQSIIRYFRITPGVYASSLGPGVDIIQSTHRYAVVPPSIHPEGRTYVGDPALELPPLPQAWIDRLYRLAEAKPSARALSELPAQPIPTTPEAMAQLRAALLEPAHGRHDRLVKVCVMASHLWKGGTLSAYDADAMIRRWWDATMDDQSRLGEQRRALLWALGQREAERVAKTAVEPSPPSGGATEADQAVVADERIRWIDWADDSVPVGVRWLVPRLVPAGKRVVLYGQPGAGKSLLGLAVAVDMAQRGIKVAYLDCESDEADARQRMAAYGWLAEGLRDEWIANLRIGWPIGQPTIDLSTTDADRLLAWVADDECVIMDSITKFVGADEDKIATWEAVDRVMERLRPRTVLWIDHGAKHDDRQRGSNGKSANVDLTYRIEPYTEHGEQRGWRVVVGKQRLVGDDKVPTSRTFRLDAGVLLGELEKAPSLPIIQVGEQPWEVEGIHRATWYRRQQRVRRDATGGATDD